LMKLKEKCCLRNIPDADFSTIYFPVATKTLNEILDSLDFSKRLPIARQFYPSLKENKHVPGFSDDPMGELKISGSTGLDFVHKYQDRLLVIASNQCPVLCRFCTRKRITFTGERRRDFPFEKLSLYMQKHLQIKEVIFSGGDPFMLPDGEIRKFMDECARFSHIKKLRFHSRALTLIPERFDEKLFLLFRDFHVQNPEIAISVVIHVNHPLEIGRKSLEVIRQFRECSIAVLSQTVLLRRVNDSDVVLGELFTTLDRSGVQPYYLHQLDRVSGSVHFEVPLETGKAIMKKLISTLPERMIPLYVLDGHEGKKQIL